MRLELAQFCVLPMRFLSNKNFYQPGFLGEETKSPIKHEALLKRYTLED